MTAEVIEFPKWRYKGDEAALVDTKEAEKALGAGWKDVPSAPAAPKDAPDAE